LLGTSTAAPYSFTWANVAAGSYSLTVKATDNRGAVTTSAAVSVSVGAQVAASTLYFIHPDHLDTPRQVTDASGKIVWRLEQQEPFGVTPASEDPDADGKAFVLNLRFAGQYFDKESGQHYNINRDYDPRTGRYIQADPIGLEDGVSLYGYVGGNPLKFVDPLGLAVTPLDAPGFTQYGLYANGATEPYYVGKTGGSMKDRYAGHVADGRAVRGKTTIRSMVGEEGSLTYSEATGAEEAAMRRCGTKNGFPGNQIRALLTRQLNTRHYATAAA
jgi:RHS repeat-associated protein